jgi:hypothetical protein
MGHMAQPRLNVGGLHKVLGLLGVHIHTKLAFQAGSACPAAALHTPLLSMSVQQMQRFN